MRKQGIVYALVAVMESEPEYIQLQSWDELIAWLEREGYKIIPEPEWNPKPKRKNKKKPPQAEGLFRRRRRCGCRRLLAELIQHGTSN